MREIKFRGRINKLPECGKEDFPYRIGDWIYGFYVRGRRVVASQVEIFHMIHTEGTIIGFIDPETLGEYTGLKDKNGKEIYEGDIIKYSYEGYGVVTWMQEKWQYGLTKGWCHPVYGFAPPNEAIIIGNIYENPELSEDK